MKMSSIKFDIQKFDGVINFQQMGDLDEHYLDPELVVESTPWEGEKAYRYEK